MMQALCITLQVQTIFLVFDKQHFRDKPFAQRGLPIQNLDFVKQTAKSLEITFF